MNREASSRRSMKWLLSLCVAVLVAAAGPGCVTVRPEQRAILADPTMSFDAEAGDQPVRQHAYENREGSLGGGTVEGGGCGCN